MANALLLQGSKLVLRTPRRSEAVDNYHRKSRIHSKFQKQKIRNFCYFPRGLSATGFQIFIHANNSHDKFIETFFKLKVLAEPPRTFQRV